MWLFRDKEIHGHDDLHPECTDFVYLIEYMDGTRYIGKKAVRAKRKKPPLKGKKRNRRVWVNLPFLKYEGSHGVKDKKIKSKEILYQCSSRKSATYIETAMLFINHVLEDNSYLNENIAGKFFPEDLKGLLHFED